MTQEHDTGAAPEETDDTGAPERFAEAGAAVNTDVTSTAGAEDLDEDRLGADPLEEGMDPPEGWTAADRHGVTAGEQARGQTLDERLRAERPDVGEVASDAPAPGGTGAATGEPGRDDRTLPPTAAAAADPEAPEPDARAADDDVPTSTLRLEDREDPGEEYR